MTLSFHAQITDSLSLKPVIVCAKKHSTLLSAKQITVDSNLLKQQKGASLADILAINNIIQIKSYGLGSTATTSIRGASANHTALVWNGIQLTNPMLGLNDLSLVPSFLFENISIQYGGTNTWGSGSVGGSVFLDNDLHFNSGLKTELQTAYGSIHSSQNQFGLNYGGARVISKTNLCYNYSKNNFAFYNPNIEGNPKQIQKHALHKLASLMQQNNFKINNQHTVYTKLWLQNNLKEIPPSLTQTNSYANLNTAFIRATADWAYTHKKYSMLTKLAYFQENLFYKDSAANLNEKSNCKNYIFETQFNKKFNSKNNLIASVNNNLAQAITANYDGIKQQNKLAANVIYNYNHPKFNFVSSIRQEYINKKTKPFTASIGLIYKPFKQLQFKANSSRVYRVPTLNELYWNPGGNANLMPESGYNQDLGILVHFNKSKLNFKSELTLFNRNIKNYIIWQPINGNIWGPKNINEIWSRGLESNSEIAYKTQKIICAFGLNTNYILSTTSKSTLANDATLDKQLAYVPMYSGGTNIKLYYKSLSIAYYQNYTGYTYTNNDNSNYIKPYSLANLFLCYDIKLKNNTLGILFNIKNLYNKQYQSISNYAMPMRNYEIAINYKLIQSKQK